MAGEKRGQEKAGFPGPVTPDARCRDRKDWETAVLSLLNFCIEWGPAIRGTCRNGLVAPSGRSATLKLPSEIA